MASTNGHAVAGALFGDLDSSPVPEVQEESLLAQAERIDAIARGLIEEVGKFRTRLMSAATSVMPLATEKEKKAHPIKACLTYFDKKHTEKTGDAAPINGGKDSSIMKRLISQYGEEKVCTLIDRFFETDDEWVTQKTGFTVGAFSSRVAGLISSNVIQPRTNGITPRTANNRQQSNMAADMIRSTYGRRESEH